MPAVAARFVPRSPRASESSPNLESVALSLATIEKLRIARGWSRQKLAERAGVSERAYKKILMRGSARHSTLRALARALARGEPRPAPPPATSVVAALHRAAMAELAREHHLPVDQVLEADFSRQRPQNRRWLAASRIRRLALYVVSVELGGIDAVTLAAAIGVTKQNVGQALAQVEERRDADRRLDRMLERVGARLAGRRA